MNRFYFRCVADPRFQYPGIFISDLQEFDVKWFILFIPLDPETYWIFWYGYGSDSQRYGSEDPDPITNPYQNVTDPEHGNFFLM